MMHIEIAARQLSGCTDFVPRPARLHLGSQNAEGVDVLAFALPPEWAGKSVSLHLERADGTPQSPLLLDGQGQVAVDRRLTAARAGRWMLTAADGASYTAYTQPGTFDTGEILPVTDGGEEPPSPTLYEQFVAQVLAHASSAASSAAKAAQSAGEAGSWAGQAAGRRGPQPRPKPTPPAPAPDVRRLPPCGPKPPLPRTGRSSASTARGGRGPAGRLGRGGPCPCPPPLRPAVCCGSRRWTPRRGKATTEAVPESSLSSFVRRTDRPTGQQAGPVKLTEGYGLALTADGELRLAPRRPKPAGRHGRGVGAPHPGAGAAGRQTGAGLGMDKRRLDRGRPGRGPRHPGARRRPPRWKPLPPGWKRWNCRAAPRSPRHTFAADLASLANLTAAGVWNEAQARLEF